MAPVVPRCSYQHLRALGDERGLFEHALFDEPRLEHGYCVDDVARALLVVSREPEQDDALDHLAETYLRFVEAAVSADGRCRNRMSSAGEWTDEPGLGDWWGRALWGLGVASRVPRWSARARSAALALASQRSPHPRAMAFAAIGAAELVSAGERDESVLALLRDATRSGRESDTGWAWPEPRLRYANGSVAEALIAAGAALGDDAVLERGLAALAFLVRVETRNGHFSVAGTAGRGPRDTGPRFDQQPIELAAIADAAARAFDVTGDPRWQAAVQSAWSWFLGDNDSGTPMIDLETGAGFDGLTPRGRNENRGAESTLAALSTQQQARRLGVSS